MFFFLLTTMFFSLFEASTLYLEQDFISKNKIQKIEVQHLDVLDLWEDAGDSIEQTFLFDKQGFLIEAQSRFHEQDSSSLYIMNDRIFYVYQEEVLWM